MQIRATDGLVNFYLPGYVETGFGASLKRVGSSIKGKFTDTNDQVIDPYVIVRPEVISALGQLVKTGGSMDARANAARAIGILRGKAAVPDLIEALHSKDSEVLYESLMALQKIRDESAAPRISFLLHDLDPKVQVAAIETTGLLQNKQAVPDLTERSQPDQGQQGEARGPDRHRHAAGGTEPRHLYAVPSRQRRQAAGRGSRGLRAPQEPERSSACCSRRGRTRAKPIRGCRWPLRWSCSAKRK